MNKKLVLVLFSIFFVLFLFLGLETGERLFPHLLGSGNVSASSLEAEVENGDNGEKEPFLLLVQVDDLSRDKPVLETVWLMSYGDPEGELLFFPLLPSQAVDGAERDRSLVSSFALDKRGYPHPDFLRILKDRNLDWSGVMLLDRIALREVVSALGGVRVEDTLYTPAEISTLWGMAQGDREKGRMIQAQFIRGVCNRLVVLDGGVSLLHLFERLPRHMALHHLTPTALSHIWQPLFTGGDSSCQFPTLSY